MGALTRTALVVASVLGTAAAVVVNESGAAAAAPAFQALQPGQTVSVETPVRVNVVFVGYRQNSIDASAVMAGLPSSGEPIVAYPAFYGLDAPVGLTYRYDYRVRFAGRKFDDAFFRYLSTSGFVTAPDFNQEQYNQMEANSLEIDQMRFIEAAPTEQWLEERGHNKLGIASTDYTVYLINWYERPDFQFHAYYKADYTDPDTGIVPGNCVCTDLVSWGGTSGRSWFLDLSAGPEQHQGSYDVDHADLTGDGVMDYRIPPIWEYGNLSGYRPFDDLEGDLNLALRYVAVDALFTASPVFDPLATLPPTPTGRKLLAVNLFDNDPTLPPAIGGLAPAAVEGPLQALEPYYPIDISVASQPLQDGPKLAFDIWTHQVTQDDCWTAFGSVFAELFCWFNDHYSEYFPTPADDVVLPGLGFTTPPETNYYGWDGLADDNYIDGRPSYFYMFETGGGFGRYSYTAAHEAGHHYGLWHPHDGYDPASGQMFRAADGDYFTLLGDGSHSMMSYLRLSGGFGAFDRDNIDRWLVARLLNEANQAAADIMDASSSVAVRKLLLRADAQFLKSLRQYAVSDWRAAAAAAAEGFRSIQQAATMAGIEISIASVMADAGGQRLLASAARQGHHPVKPIDVPLPPEPTKSRPAA